MKGLFLPCSMVVVLTFASSSANADDGSSKLRPVAIASFPGYSKLKGDLDYLGSLAGNPELAAGLEKALLPFAIGRELAGLDRERPSGVALVVSDDGPRFFVLGFLPVEDLSKLLSALPGLETDQVGDGIYKVEHETNTFFVLQQGKWAYAAGRKGDLKDLPVDPLKWQHGLKEPYDLSLCITPQNIPPALRGLSSVLIKQGLAARIRLNRDVDEEHKELLAQVLSGASEELVKSLDRLDQLTVGFKVDRVRGRTSLDAEVKVVPDKTAHGRRAIAP